MSLFSYFCFLLTDSGFKFTQKHIKQLNKFSTTPEAALKAGSLELRNLGLNPKQVRKLLNLKTNFNRAAYNKLLSKHNNSTVSYFEPSYPKQLRNLHDPPLLLYYQGNLSVTRQSLVAVVGNRRITSYGRLVTSHLLKPFQGSQIGIVSGLAYGIDAEAHQVALANDLPTIAVLGSGISHNSLYPRTHWQLAQNIVKHGGLLISEYPPQQEARGWQFVARNRIIAGLSQATAIVECQAKSGSLITADYALDLGRPVLAVPGSILQSSSEGTNQLLKHGAIPLIQSQDLAEVLDISLQSATSQPHDFQLTKLEQRVLECMHEPINIDQLAEQTQLSSPQLLSLLSKLELYNLISSPYPGTYMQNHAAQ